MKKAIVTGANGFVGLAVTKELVAQGYFVYAIVRSNNYDKFLYNKSVKVLLYNMSEYDNIIDVINGEVDFFFHFAWDGTSGELRANEKVQIKNIEYSCNAIRVAKKIGCKRFIMPSSIMEYEVEQLTYQTVNVSKNHIYSSAKRAANMMCRLIANNVGIDYIVGLISNIYGVGEKSLRLINYSIRKFLNHELVKFSPGNQKYDFIYITDAAKIFVLIAEKGKNNNTYYIGNAEIKTLKDYLIELGKTINATNFIEIGGLPSIGNGIDYSLIDTYKVKKELGYENKVKFSQGIVATYNWIKENL